MTGFLGRCPYRLLPVGDKRRDLYERLLPEIRRVAWDFGYAAGVHGTMRRDLDLIACPWIATAAAPRVFVEALARDLRVPAERPWIIYGDIHEARAHGRQQWVIHLTDEFGGGPYLDISIPWASTG